MVTRNIHRKTYKRFNNSNISVQNNIVPPWCSSGKLCERRKPRNDASPPSETQSSYSLRENIWEYLYQDKSEQTTNSKTKIDRIRWKQRPIRNKKCFKKFLIIITFLIITIGVFVSFWFKIPQKYLSKKMFSNPTSLLNLKLKYFTTEDDACNHGIKYLSFMLFQAQKSLRSKNRLQKVMIASKSADTSIQDSNFKKNFIYEATVMKGSKTTEWSGRMSLWGVVPLWHYTPPLHTILALRKPTPSDCWPFRGSYAEIIIEFPYNLYINCISIEHIRPDTARSAPRNFAFYSILENDTWIKTLEGKYRYRGISEQFYHLKQKISAKRVILQILSNQGNPNYTCVYRVHVYGRIVDNDN